MAQKNRYSVPILVILCGCMDGIITTSPADICCGFNSSTSTFAKTLYPFAFIVYYLAHPGDAKLTAKTKTNNFIILSIFPKSLYYKDRIQFWSEFFAATHLWVLLFQ